MALCTDRVFLSKFDIQHHSRLHLLAIRHVAFVCKCSLEPVRMVCTLLRITFTDNQGLELSSLGLMGCIHICRIKPYWQIWCTGQQSWADRGDEVNVETAWSWHDWCHGRLVAGRRCPVHIYHDLSKLWWCLFGSRNNDILLSVGTFGLCYLMLDARGCQNYQLEPSATAHTATQPAAAPTCTVITARYTLHCTLTIPKLLLLHNPSSHFVLHLQWCHYV